MKSLGIPGSRTLLYAVILFCCACGTTQKRDPWTAEKALEPVQFIYPEFEDDMDRESLIAALEKNIAYLKRVPPRRPFQYGPHTFTAQQVRESQEAFLDLILENPDPKRLFQKISDNFRVYAAAGHEGNNRVLFTGYFEPTYPASLAPDEIFRYPLYKRPKDLVTADLSLFKKTLKGHSIVGRIEGNRLMPYFSKKEIDHDGALKGRRLELAWLKDPVDVAFLQIQGSGRLKLQGGDSIMMGYSAKNGRPYRGIGRYMLDKGFLTREEMSMQAIRSYLREHPDVVSEVLFHNPSYVFFRPLEKGPVGNIGVPLTPGRSLALDSNLFPKGALGFISCQKPVLNEEGKITRWKPFSRFMINQDTGGAIKGPGRADIFWGNGPYAKAAAGHQKHIGKLYILMKKP